MIQEIITAIIVFSAVGYTIYSIIQFFKNLNGNTLCSCSGCHSKELQEIIKKSKQKNIHRPFQK
ncbi:MAG: FeoB-associated Cys-rich membrane protein [Bacteroidota bacterium]